MAPKCSKSFYYDELTTACESCQLRCSNPATRPTVCADQLCDKAAVSSLYTWNNETLRNSWIIIGLLPLLIVILFVLILVARKLHQRKASTSFKSTEVVFDRDVTASSFKGKSLAEDVQEFPPVRNQQFDLSVECEISNCIPQENEMENLAMGAERNCDCATSFPLPATEEGATILVTTKTVEWSGYH